MFDFRDEIGSSEPAVFPLSTHELRGRGQAAVATGPSNSEPGSSIKRAIMFEATVLILYIQSILVTN